MKIISKLPLVLLSSIYSCSLFALETTESCNSLAPESRFEISEFGDEVLDLETNLVWKRCSEGQYWNGEICLRYPQKFCS